MFFLHYTSIEKALSANKTNKENDRLRKIQIPFVCPGINEIAILNILVNILQKEQWQLQAGLEIIQYFEDTNFLLKLRGKREIRQAYKIDQITN